jgi:hypothetical protein
LRFQAQRPLHRRRQCLRVRRAGGRGRLVAQDLADRGVRRAEERAGGRVGTSFYHGGRWRGPSSMPAYFDAPGRRGSGARRNRGARRCRHGARFPSRDGARHCRGRQRLRSHQRLRRCRRAGVRGRIIATVPLSNNLMSELMPRQVMRTETRKAHYSYRPSPDGADRAWCGRAGRTKGRQAGPRRSARSVRALDLRLPPLIPLYNGEAWFLPAVFAWLGLRIACAGARSRRVESGRRAGARADCRTSASPAMPGAGRLADHAERS